MPVDADEIWKPGYGGPTPVAPSAQPDPAIERARTDRRRRSGRAPAVVVVVVCVLGVAGVLSARAIDDAGSASSAIPVVRESVRIDDSGGGPADGDQLRRIPATATELWRSPIEVEPEDEVWVEAIGRRDVVVAHGSPKRPDGSTTVIVLDALTGEPRWSVPFATPWTAVTFVAVIDDVLVVHIGSSLRALEFATGEPMWAYDVGAEPAGTESYAQIDGTRLLTNWSRGSSLIDVTTGRAAGRFDGMLIGIDDAGRIYLERHDEVAVYDVGEGFSEPTLTIAGIDGDVAALIGDRVVTSGFGGWRATFPGGGIASILIDLSEPSDELPTPSSSILATTSDTFLASGSGVTYGVRLDRAQLTVVWTRRGITTRTFRTDGGAVAMLATDGGAVQTLVDATTGRTITELTMVPGVFDVLRVVDNGIVTRRSSVDGVRLAALDLDGRELWSLVAAEGAVGDRIVVLPERSPDGSMVLRAVGEPN